MKQKATSFIALFFLMLITGVFWGTWFTLTRSLETFSPEEFIHIGQTIILNVAVPMRIIMPSGILFMILAIWFAENKKSAAFYSAVISLALIITVLLITLVVLVPIDNEIRVWTADTIPGDWLEKRQTWNLFHSIRTFLSLASFACFSVFVIFENRNAGRKHTG